MQDNMDILYADLGDSMKESGRRINMKEFGKGAKDIDMSLAIKISNRVHEQEQPTKPAKEETDDLSNKEKVQGIAMLITLPTLILLADIIGGIFHLWN